MNWIDTAFDWSETVGGSGFWKLISRKWKTAVIDNEEPTEEKIVFTGSISGEGSARRKYCASYITTPGVALSGMGSNRRSIT